MTVHKQFRDMKLSEIQAKIKAPKGQFNSFGKYKYRSCEDIVEAVKPIINPLGFALILTDEVIEVGGRIYVKSTALLTDGVNHFNAVGYAREEETKKGMDASQITGAASSYARKYALNGLFAIDDTQDSDSTNKHGKEESKKEELTTSHKWYAGVVKALRDGTKTRTQLEEKINISEEVWQQIQKELEI
jgi:hypothetical protein